MGNFITGETCTHGKLHQMGNSIFLMVNVVSVRKEIGQEQIYVLINYILVVCSFIQTFIRFDKIATKSNKLHMAQQIFSYL